jgi:hypothetical protein
MWPSQLSLCARMKYIMFVCFIILSSFWLVGELTSNYMKIQHSATADTQSNICSRTHQCMNTDRVYNYTDFPYVEENCVKYIRERFPGT